MEYYGWEVNLKKLKTKKMTRKEALEFLEFQEGKRGISEEKAIEIYCEAEEEIKNSHGWHSIQNTPLKF